MKAAEVPAVKDVEAEKSTHDTNKDEGKDAAESPSDDATTKEE